MPRPGSTSQRGYGTLHQKRRKHYDPAVRAGNVNCWRCGKRIEPGAAWDLGHDDNDRTKYRGPEHVKCNRSAAGRASQQHRQPAQTPRNSRNW